MFGNRKYVPIYIILNHSIQWPVLNEYLWSHVLIHESDFQSCVLIQYISKGMCYYDSILISCMQCGIKTYNYGVATVSRIDQIIYLFCRISPFL